MLGCLVPHVRMYIYICTLAVKHFFAFARAFARPVCGNLCELSLRNVAGDNLNYAVEPVVGLSEILGTFKEASHAWLE